MQTFELQTVKLLAAVMISLASIEVSSAASASLNDHPKTATCVISEGANDTKNYAVFYLAGFGTDGSSYYRTISAPIFELTVKSDGSVESNANPCKDEAEFQR